MRHSTHLTPLLTGLVFASASAQDVELLGERYGTRVPDGYYETMAREVDAFRFAHGRAMRMRQAVAEATLGGDPGVQPLRSLVPSMVLGSREGPVAGESRIPVVLGLFSDSPQDGGPYDREEIESAYFSENPGTITAYYVEASRGGLELFGDVHDWVRATSTQAQATGGDSGLKAGTVGPFIVQLLQRMGGTDWGAYDNDGPDGLPNSGDDDGFVDALAVLHPNRGAECGGAGSEDRIWSHRWTLSAAAGAPFVTGTPAAGGGTIVIDDYIVQPAVACSGHELNEIGVFTHELGHAFGLQDLYDTDDSDGKHSGAGNWDLMASGAWGCDGQSPARPCHLGAWSKAILGWVDVVLIPDDTDLGVVVLPPVEATGTVYRVDAADESGEYFLLENRQRLGFDLRLPNEGLLVWQVNPSIVAAQWTRNRVNAGRRMGVWLRQADGLDELGKGQGRGDAGDPFPLELPNSQDLENREFHAASSPSARSERGTATGLTLLDVRRIGDDVTFRLTTRLTRLSVRSEGDDGTGGLFRVNGEAIPAAEHTFRSAPFVENSVEAAAGESLADGERRPFRDWLDDASAPRSRMVTTPLVDTTFVARYEGRELELRMEVTGGQNGVAPGSFRTFPASEDLWFAAGASVSIEAVPQTGFDFVGWSGALAGQPNPASVEMVEPLSAGADFVLTYAVPSATLTLTAAVQQDVELIAENGTAPFFWRLTEGTLPDGLNLDILGKLLGVPMEVGTFPLTVQVHDALGLTAVGTLTLDVAEPALSPRQLASPFLTVGPPLDEHHRRFLDRQGNGDGSYDLGDLRAWVLAHPGVRLGAPTRALLARPEPSEIVITILPDTIPGGVR
jgi:M6 family metalloprotease-like protein